MPDLSSAATTSALTLTEREQRGNIWRLATAQALAGANGVVIFATGAIAGHALAPAAWLATLPVSVFVVGMALATLPVGWMARRYGRRTAFLAGSFTGLLTGLIAMLAMHSHDFWLFCLATFLGGAYGAVVLSFRFAAADAVAPERKAQSLSSVMAGGVIAGVVGPQLVTWTQAQWPEPLYAATFLGQAVVALLATWVLWGVRLPRLSADQLRGGRPLLQVALQPSFIAAVVAGTVSYLVMNFLMTSAPLAMQEHGHSHVDANLGLQWHVIAMFGPSFFTGKLIARFGVLTITSLGLVLIGVAAAIGLAGVDVMHFWWMLVLLGIGWNFGFLGASAWVLQCHRPEEATRVQALNDFIVFGFMAAGSFASGGILTHWGWGTVLWVSFIPVSLALIAFAAVARH